MSKSSVRVGVRVSKSSVRVLDLVTFPLDFVTFFLDLVTFFILSPQLVFPRISQIYTDLSLIKCVDPPSALAIELDDMGKGLVDRKYMITERVHTPPVHRGI